MKPETLRSQMNQSVCESREMTQGLTLAAFAEVPGS